MPDRKLVSRVALWSIPVAVAIMGIKALAWGLTGSVALLSDALESTVNVIAAVVAWSAIRIAARPADDNHPFGHYKAEYFSAVIEGVLIVLAALLIMREAVAGLLDPKPMAAPAAGMAINALAAVGSAIWARYLIRVGREHHSAALISDGRHIMTDVVTSVGVLAGLGLSLATGLPVLDPLLAFVVAANILREGGRVIRDSVDVLMDVSVPPEEAARIETAILENAIGADEVHDIRTRRVGPVLFIEFHLVVEGTMSVAESHAICDRIEDALEALSPRAHVSIHVEPAEMAKPAGLPVPPI